jgi:hypothetical protein
MKMRARGLLPTKKIRPNISPTTVFQPVTRFRNFVCPQPCH